MGVDGIGEVGDRANERQAAGVYGAGFTSGSLAGKGARGGTSNNFLLNFPPSIPHNPLVAPFKNSLVTPFVSCVHIHSFILF